MILAAGVGTAGYVFAIMLLLTHGFFKAGLFLGAGSVMHGMNDEVDMRKYGGLARAMPITFVTFGLCYLAIIGVPPLSGFFAKDKIIEVAFNEGGTRGWIVGGAALVGAGITAFYMTRVVIMTFFGERRWERDAHPHESPRVMTWPMIVLAIGSVFAGALLTFHDSLEKWLAPVVGTAPEEENLIAPAVVTSMTLGIVAIGILLAVTQYGRRAIPRPAPAAVSLRHVSRPPRSLRRRSERGTVHATGPVPHPVAGVPRQQGPRRHRQRAGGAGRRLLRPNQTSADRLRSLLRPVHVRRRRTRHHRSAIGEALR